jgi:hypothetical protein
LEYASIISSDVAWKRISGPVVPQAMMEININLDTLWSIDSPSRLMIARTLKLPHCESELPSNQQSNLRALNWMLGRKEMASILKGLLGVVPYFERRVKLGVHLKGILSF